MWLSQICRAMRRICLRRGEYVSTPNVSLMFRVYCCDLKCYAYFTRICSRGRRHGCVRVCSCLTACHESVQGTRQEFVELRPASQRRQPRELWWLMQNACASHIITGASSLPSLCSRIALTVQSALAPITFPQRCMDMSLGRWHG